MKIYLSVVAVSAAIFSANAMAVSFRLEVPSAVGSTSYNDIIIIPQGGPDPRFLGAPRASFDNGFSEVRIVRFGFNVPASPYPYLTSLYPQGFSIVNSGTIIINRSFEYFGGYELTYDAPNTNHYPPLDGVNSSAYRQSYQVSFSGRLSSFDEIYQPADSLIAQVLSGGAFGGYSQSEQLVVFFSLVQTTQVRGTAHLVSEVSPIPEPETYALMLVGLFGVGCAVRAKRASVRQIA